MKFRNHQVPFKVVGGCGASPAPDPRGHGVFDDAAAPSFVRFLPMRGHAARFSFNDAVLADDPGQDRGQVEV